MKPINCVDIIFICYLFSEVATASRLNIVSVYEEAICNIKTSCLECLRLSQCSWYPTESKCFSEKLLVSEKYSKKEIIRYPNYESEYRLKYSDEKKNMTTLYKYKYNACA